MSSRVPDSLPNQATHLESREVKNITSRLVVAEVISIGDLLCVLGGSLNWASKLSHRLPSRF